MNAALGNIGKTVFYSDPVLANTANSNDSLKELVADMRAGKVDLLVILGGNPVYDAPADFGFADALKNANIPVRVHLGLHQDETAELCHWHVNEAHYLEAWGDTKAYDGSVCIVQPLIAPLYNGKSALEVTAFLAGPSQANGSCPELLENKTVRRRLRHVVAQVGRAGLDRRHDGAAKAGVGEVRQLGGNFFFGACEWRNRNQLPP